MIDEIDHHHGVSYDTALELNQNIFGSLCLRRWIIWNPVRKRFHVSSLGKEARQVLDDWNLRRKTNNHVLAKRARPVYKYRGLKVA